FQTFSLAYTRRVLSRLKREYEGQRIPSIIFTKGGGLWLEDMAAAGADAIGLDWTVNLGQARTRVADACALQGNLDPSVLFAPPDAIRAEVTRLLQGYGQHQPGSGHIFNLGHGISQFTPPESVSILVDTVHEVSRAFHVAPESAQQMT
ncbi:MAG: uroporphyrinogen decarboxylase family protein, partial [Burkholderiales bacterium]